jgi:hypothetical protein
MHQADAARDELGIRQRAHAKGDVDMLLREIDNPIGEDEAQRDLGEYLQKLSFAYFRDSGKGSGFAAVSTSTSMRWSSTQSALERLCGGLLFTFRAAMGHERILGPSREDAKDT